MSNFLTGEEVKSFQRLVLKIYGKVLSNEEAYDQGSRLIMLFELMIRNRKTAEDLLKHY